MNKQQLYKTIVEQSPQEQIIVAIEELSELQKELTKHLRGIGRTDHIAEEICDCEIMLKQLKILFHCSNNVKEWEIKKLKRIKKIIEERIQKNEKN